MKEITQEEVKERFEYKDGGLYYKHNIGTRGRKGMRFGHIYESGYIQGGFHGRRYLEHRLIFLYHNGYLPKEEIDHIDGNTLNNKIENLREADRSQNMMNRQKQNKPTTSKYKGVSKIDDGRQRPWHSYIAINKKRIELGYFLTEIEGAIAYNIAAIELFGEYVCLNDIKTI